MEKQGEDNGKSEGVYGGSKELKVTEIPGPERLVHRVSGDIGVGREEGIAEVEGWGKGEECIAVRDKKIENTTRPSVMTNAVGEGVEVSVLRALDPNVIRSATNVGKGAWKRRARQTGKTEDKVAEEGEAMDCDRTNGNGKRGLRLRDESSLEQENIQVEKKAKVNQMDNNHCALMVGDASHNRHHPDQ